MFGRRPTPGPAPEPPLQGAAKPKESRPGRITALCGWCESSFEQNRSDQEYCSRACRRAAWEAGASVGKVKSAGRLKDGRWSVVVHLDRDIGLKPGEVVRLGPEK